MNDRRPPESTLFPIEVHPRQWVKDFLRFFCERWPALSVYVWPIMRLRGRKLR